MDEITDNIHPVKSARFAAVIIITSMLIKQSMIIDIENVITVRLILLHTQNTQFLSINCKFSYQIFIF